MTNECAWIKWDKPESNGAPITTYRVYMSSIMARDIGTVNFKAVNPSAHSYEMVAETTETSHTLHIEYPDCLYYVLVTAVNSNGEGYKTPRPTMIRSQHDSIHKTSQLVVFGSNTNSEIGLSEDMVRNNSASYKKTKDSVYLCKPLVHDSFGSMVHQVACGSSHSLVVCIEPNTKQTMII